VPVFALTSLLVLFLCRRRGSLFSLLELPAVLVLTRLRRRASLLLAVLTVLFLLLSESGLRELLRELDTLRVLLRLLVLLRELVLARLLALLPESESCALASKDSTLVLPKLSSFVPLRESAFWNLIMCR
jgi:hypothetical protein